MATSTPRLTGAPAAGRAAGAVRWIGPLFLANASASRLAATCLAHENACPVAALAGIAIRKSEVPRVASERARAPGDSA
jgi:hypothetical protein